MGNQPATNSIRESIEYDLDDKLVWSTVQPPPFPTPHHYQPCFCEENVYLLIQALSTQLSAGDRADGDVVAKWDVRAVFISNETQTTLLFQQKASKAPETGWPVVWDYHVVAAVSCTLLAPDGTSYGTRTWIYDPDSNLSADGAAAIVPVPIDTYLSATFAPQTLEQYRAMFRVVAANDFLAVFASDRSHMKTVCDDEPSGYRWHEPPPSWPVIRGERAQSAHNLMSAFVNVTPASAHSQDPHFGKVYDLSALSSLQWAHPFPGSTLSSCSQSAQQVARNVGGRVSSSLFTAYLHAAHQHRAHTPDTTVTVQSDA